MKRFFGVTQDPFIDPRYQKRQKLEPDQMSFNVIEIESDIIIDDSDLCDSPKKASGTGTFNSPAKSLQMNMDLAMDSESEENPFEPPVYGISSDGSAIATTGKLINYSL
mgnify:CR=1 FL=1